MKERTSVKKLYLKRWITAICYTLLIFAFLPVFPDLWSFLSDACDNCWGVANPDQLDLNENCPPPPYSSGPACGDACENICRADFNGD